MRDFKFNIITNLGLMIESSCLAHSISACEVEFMIIKFFLWYKKYTKWYLGAASNLDHDSNILLLWQCNVYPITFFDLWLSSSMVASSSSANTGFFKLSWSSMNIALPTAQVPNPSTPSPNLDLRFCSSPVFPVHLQQRLRTTPIIERGWLLSHTP